MAMSNAERQRKYQEKKRGGRGSGGGQQDVTDNDDAVTYLMSPLREFVERLNDVIGITYWADGENGGNVTAEDGAVGQPILSDELSDSASVPTEIKPYDPDAGEIITPDDTPSGSADYVTNTSPESSVSPIFIPYGDLPKGSPEQLNRYRKMNTLAEIPAPQRTNLLLSEPELQAKWNDFCHTVGRDEDRI
jgi:hypothetical protein